MTWQETYDFYYKKAIDRGESEAEANTYASIEADIMEVLESKRGLREI